MAELAWLTSSPAAKVSVNASSSFNNSNENLFDLLQGRLGTGAFGGAAGGTDSSPYFRTSDQMSNVTVVADHTDSAISLMKAEDGNDHLQSSLWIAAAAAAAVDGIYSASTAAAAAVHVPSIDSCSQLSTYVKPHDPSPQLQALRDFMAYGSNNHSMSTLSNVTVENVNLTPAGPPMFLHLGDESPASLLVGMPHHSNSIAASSQTKGPDMMAYRALCQAELFAAERSPHRTQFQRENHILAERQRREEMNEKFSALRSMIPKATKKDKASIVGDTIAYVLELEKTLKHLKACKDSRKGYSFKVLKKKSSLKGIDECERSVSDTGAENAAVAAEETKPGPSCTTRFEDISASKDCKEREDPTSISTSEKISADSSCLKHKAKEKDNPVDVDTSRDSQVEVQNLGEQAVIKIVCARSRGLVLRILQALDECKMDILQSNVTTVSHHAVHFITVQLIPEEVAWRKAVEASLEQYQSWNINAGLSCTIQHMIEALLKASNPNQTAET